jgi:hypothetical protein
MRLARCLCAALLLLILTVELRGQDVATAADTTASQANSAADPAETISNPADSISEADHPNVPTFNSELNSQRNSQPPQVPQSSTEFPDSSLSEHTLSEQTLCKDKCKTDCKAYRIPIGKCFNPNTLFPGDSQWGHEDVKDVLKTTNTIIISTATTDSQSSEATANGNSSDNNNDSHLIADRLSDVKPLTLERTLFSSRDGSCQTPTGHFEVPLGICVGPFGDPRPWGSFRVVERRNTISINSGDNLRNAGSTVVPLNSGNDEGGSNLDHSSWDASSLWKGLNKIDGEDSEVLNSVEFV